MKPVTPIEKTGSYQLLENHAAECIDRSVSDLVNRGLQYEYQAPYRLS